VFTLEQGRTPAALPAAFRPGKESVRLPRSRQNDNLEVIYAARWYDYEASITPRSSCAPHLVPNFHLQF